MKKRHILAMALAASALLTFSHVLTQESPPLIRVDTDGVTIRSHPALEWAQILGQVVNETAFPIGNVTVNVVIKGTDGKILDAGAIPVLGHTVDLDGQPNDQGILPGGSAVFDDTFLNIDASDVSSYEFSITYRVADTADALTASTLSTRLEGIESTVSSNASRITTLEGRVDSANSGGSPLIGDLDSDFDVDFQDFLVFSVQFGKTL